MQFPLPNWPGSLRFRALFFAMHAPQVADLAIVDAQFYTAPFDGTCTGSAKEDLKFLEAAARLYAMKMKWLLDNL